MGAVATAGTSTGEVTDDELVLAVRRGDDRAFETLYWRYEGRVSAFIAGRVGDHARAEDVTQEVFFSALRRMRKTSQPIAFKPWIYEIARNACIDQFRRGKRAEELSYDDALEAGGSEESRLFNPALSPEAAVESKQRLEHLQGAFGGLSEQHHEIVVLRELEGLSYREIGERMQLTRPAVESTLFRARKRLNEEYEELVSGRRCERVQAALEVSGDRALGVRDRRRIERHLTCCQICRHHLCTLETQPKRGAVARLGALIPFPVLRRSRGQTAGTEVASAKSSSVQGLLVHLPVLGAAAEPVAAPWLKAIATAAAVAVAGLGAGAITHTGPISLSDLGKLPLVRTLDHGGSGAGDSSRGAPGAGGGADSTSQNTREPANDPATSNVPAGAESAPGDPSVGADPDVSSAVTGALPGVPTPPASSAPDAPPVGDLNTPNAPAPPAVPDSPKVDSPAVQVPDAPVQAPDVKPPVSLPAPGSSQP